MRRPGLWYLQVKLHPDEQKKMAITRARLDREAAWQIFIQESSPARIAYRATIKAIEERLAAER